MSSTSTAQGTDMRPLAVSREPRNGQEPSTASDYEDAEFERTLRDFAGKAPAKEREEKAKLNSASKDEGSAKKQKSGDKLFDIYTKTASELRSAFEKAAGDQAKREEQEAVRQEETRAYREESLKVGRLLAGGLQAIAKAFSPKR